MELQIKQEITVDDFMKDVKWFGESDKDDQTIKRLKELNRLMSDLTSKIYWLKLDTEEIATNQNSASARRISEEAKKLLIDVAKMTTEEENWDMIDKLF